MNPLKIITLYKNEKLLISRAASGNSQSQRLIYEHYAPKMLSVCRQYIRDLQFAEDVMVQGFVKVFRNLKNFRNEGSFEGWIRRIMVREAIDYLRKRQFVVFDEAVMDKRPSAKVDVSTSLEVEEIQAVIDSLPEGYRMVFVLYAIEGYKHQEIAEMLEITESTSKSQLYKARKVLQEKLAAQNRLGYGTR
jgi:RNA polymerase sigma-70 factor (ECF subfamily)